MRGKRRYLASRTARKMAAAKLTGRRRDKQDWSSQEMRRYFDRYYRGSTT